jgi:hypothetical protein
MSLTSVVYFFNFIVLESSRHDFIVTNNKFSNRGCVELNEQL